MKNELKDFTKLNISGLISNTLKKSKVMVTIAIVKAMNAIIIAIVTPFISFF